MSSDGRQLEALVFFVERLHLPDGFDVKANERVFNDEGVQIAEFDIEIRGKVGTTEIGWLIECRDRPEHGAAPGSWIEQLVGRRARFGFNKVTAVSTTGFAAGAADFARQQGIELREVRNLEPTEFEDWLQISTMRRVLRIADLKHASFVVDGNETQSRKAAALKAIKAANGGDPLLISSVTKEAATPSQAFLAAVQSIPDAFDPVTPDRPREMHVISSYKDEDHFLIETAEGAVRLATIEFLGELRLEETEFPVIKTVEYRHSDSGAAISQVAAFEPQSILGQKLSFELHRVASSGQIHVAIRNLSKAK
jgi:hypothetical protein